MYISIHLCYVLHYYACIMYRNKEGKKLSCFVVKFVENSQNLLFSPADIMI